MMVAADATLMVWLSFVSVSTVTDVPLTAVPSPLTTAPFGRGVAAGRGLALGRGLAAGFGLGTKGRAQTAAALGARRRLVAVSAPAVSFWPLAVMHVPRVMSARVAVEVLVNVVAVVYVTTMSPFGPVKMRVCPLT